MSWISTTFSFRAGLGKSDPSSWTCHDLCRLVARCNIAILLRGTSACATSYLHVTIRFQAFKGRHVETEFAVNVACFAKVKLGAYHDNDSMSSAMGSKSDKLGRKRSWCWSSKDKKQVRVPPSSPIFCGRNIWGSAGRFCGGFRIAKKKPV